MGKCSVCGKKINYNSYKVIKGIVYCLNCKSVNAAEKLKIVVDEAIDVDFDKLQAAMKEPGILIADRELTKQLGEPMKMSITPVKQKKRKRKVKKPKDTTIDNGYIAKNLYNSGKNPQPKKPAKKGD